MPIINIYVIHMNKTDFDELKRYILQALLNYERVVLVSKARVKEVPMNFLRGIQEKSIKIW